MQLAENNLTVNEAGSPFALLQNVFAKTNQQNVAADAYRQVTYLNDTTYENTQVLMEYATNGSFGSTTTAYSFGVQRESFVETTAGMGAGAAMGGMAYQRSGTYYYTGTGSVANVTGTATNQSYSYTISGSMAAYAMSASAGNTTGTLTTNPTAYGTYGVYGYNGEYTHTGLGLQYLRARYLNVATGTFTSRDTYAGRMQDILSQNRYTYAENNPVGHSDPSGHAVKSGISSILKKAANTIKASVTGQSSGNVKKGNTPTSNIAAAYKSSSLNYVRAQAQLNASLAKAEKSRAKAELIEKPLEWYQSASAWVDKGLVKVAGYLDSSWSGPYAEAFATWVVEKECQAYDYCVNKIQEAIPGSDGARVLKGAGLILGGTFKVAGGLTLSLASTPFGWTGLGVLGVTAGGVTTSAGISDIQQGGEEFFLGLEGDNTTITENAICTALFGGNESIYHASTFVSSMAGSFLRPYVNTAYSYPKNIQSYLETSPTRTIPQQLTREGQTPVIGKMNDLNSSGNVVAGEFKVADYLPDLGVPKANWYQNSGILRSVMNEGVPIKDVSTYPMNNAGFLGAERNLLQSKGWTYYNGYWYPPK